MRRLARCDEHHSVTVPPRHGTCSWAEEEAAVERGDLDAAVEANLRMWVDGPNRTPGQVDTGVRSFVGEMQRRAFELQVLDVTP